MSLASDPHRLYQNPETIEVRVPQKLHWTSSKDSFGTSEVENFSPNVKGSEVLDGSLPSLKLKIAP